MKQKITLDHPYVIFSSIKIHSDTEVCLEVGISKGECLGHLPTVYKEPTARRPSQGASIPGVGTNNEFTA